MMCGWLRDEFSVTWQLVHGDMGAMLAGADTTAVTRLTQAVFTIFELDIAALRAAFKGETGWASWMASWHR